MLPQRFCPQCGGPAGSAPFCPRCGSQVPYLPSGPRYPGQSVYARPPPPQNSHRLAKALAAVIALTLVFLVADSLLIPHGNPSAGSPGLPSEVNTVFAGHGTLAGHGIVYAPVLPNATSVSGLVSGGSIASSSLSLVLSTYASGDVAYLAVSIPDPTIHVASIHDTANLTWAIRSANRGLTEDLEAWYATSPKALDRDNITVKLSGSASAQAVVAGFSGIRDLADPFAAVAANASGSGSDASVLVRTSGPAIVLGILAAPGNVTVNASNGFTLEQERRPPTLALESVKNFRVCLQNCLPGRTSLVIRNVSALATLTPSASWRMLGDAIVSGLPTFGHPPKGSNQTGPVVATCATGGTLVPSTVTDSAYAEWYQGYTLAALTGSVLLTGVGSGYVSYSAGGEQCSIAAVPSTAANASFFCVCDLYVIVYNNQSAPASYAVQSYLTNQSSLPEVLGSVLGVAAAASSSGSGSGSGGGGGSGIVGPWLGISSLTYEEDQQGGSVEEDLSGAENFQVSASGAISGWGSMAGFVSWTYADPNCMGGGVVPLEYTESLSGQVAADGSATVRIAVSVTSETSFVPETCVYVNADGSTTTVSDSTTIPEQSFVYNTTEQLRFVPAYQVLVDLPSPLSGTYSYFLIRG